MARVAEALAGLDAEARAHADLPKHAFGSCAICTRRLVSAPDVSGTITDTPFTPAASPTRFLVQTGPALDRMDGGR